MEDAQGRSATITIPVPWLEILVPQGESLLAFGAENDNCRSLQQYAAGTTQQSVPVAECRLTGRTDPGNTIQIDGKHITVKKDGLFMALLSLKHGENSFGIVARNPAGYTRVASLGMTVSDRRKDGERIIAAKPVPDSGRNRVM